MNLVAGRLEAGTFLAEGVRIPGFTGVADGPATLGFRAEDAQIAQAGEIDAPVYSMELLGDSSMATLQIGSGFVAVKAAKNFSATIGQRLGAHVPARICHLFDHETGERLAWGAA
jgi:multiple sugar transport system ATP-binding protein